MIRQRGGNEVVTGGSTSEPIVGRHKARLMRLQVNKMPVVPPLRIRAVHGELFLSGEEQ